jgi:hypothetical protein
MWLPGAAGVRIPATKATALRCPPVSVLLASGSLGGMEVRLSGLSLRQEVRLCG